MTWYYDLSPFSLACSCIVESSLGLMCSDGTSRFPSPRPRPRACGRPGQAGCPPRRPRAPPAPSRPLPCPCPRPCPSRVPAQGRWHGLVARRRPGPACGALCMPGQRWGPGTGVSPRPCHPLQTVTINMASTCDPHGASSAASPRASLLAHPKLSPAWHWWRCPQRLSRRSLCRCSGRQTVLPGKLFPRLLFGSSVCYAACLLMEKHGAAWLF